MLMLIHLRSLLALVAVTLFSLSTVAADANIAPEFYQPGEYELSRHDDEQVDGALKEILALLKMKNSGSEHVAQAAKHLNSLVNIHKANKLGTKERLSGFAMLAEQAKMAHENLAAMPQDLAHPADMKCVMDDAAINPVVKKFIKDYFAGLHEFTHDMAQLAAVAPFGFSIGAGLGMATYLSGDRYLTGCLSLGVAAVPSKAAKECVWVGADASLERVQGESSSCFSSTHRLHQVVGAGVVDDIADTSAPSHGFSGYRLEEDGIDGIGVGVAAMEVVAGTLEGCLFPLTSSYHYARKHLEITHEPQACEHEASKE